jgi:hypothetical protein
MLYNKDWDKPKETKKLEMWTLPHLIAWLETKPVSGRYEYCDNRHCLMCQYTKEHLGGKVTAGSSHVTLIAGLAFLSWRKTYTLPKFFDWIARSSDGSYGSALAKARAVSEFV